MKPVLYVGNRNYSSWSLRPWLALTWGKIDFETRVLKLGGPGYGKREIAEVLAINPAGTVPALHVGDAVIADSLAISEWAAEQVPGLWPQDGMARALARAAASEMHSGFGALRANCPCNIRRRIEPRELSDDARRDVARLESIWTSLRARFGRGGPYLFGTAPTIADAFFTPIAIRLRTYAVNVGPEAGAYAAALLANPAFLEWEAEALREAWSMPQWDAF